MTPKTLVTGFITAAAAAAVVGGAAAGVTSIASSGMSTSPAIQPVVFGAPLPATPAPDLASPLVQTLQALANGGSFSGKAPYIQGGIGRIESIAADRAYSKAAAEGKFPLTFNIANIDDQGGVAYADVTATSATGGTATQNIQFVAGPSPTGWQISKGSAMALLSSVG
ncbi:hypothetical protein [Mycolicibacterium nivoides]|uniref:Low molecular weight antigen MTB12-like C-terminal domain-containing protein n=2 Tax=Actinomycetes TaxID=1760 RepID=A0ABW9LI53_9MYCO|nr:hypothetical protein [Mycolicibacterium nivoides]MBN3508925.1 hypothetical protein [Mycolicibacterium septicum]QRY44673.1 hypothetical protein JVX93_30395 [Mycolicibacterium boenickei]SER29730.1 hypothetical protein SAMN04488583_4818 [Mycobacterium sp. 88mf]SFG18126.1 hypothetical protein SAMN04488582_105611 [Mycobacterium sp. 455mf]